MTKWTRDRTHVRTLIWGGLLLEIFQNPDRREGRHEQRVWDGAATEKDAANPRIEPVLEAANA